MWKRKLAAGTKLPQGQQRDVLWWPRKYTTQISCYGRLVSLAAAPLDPPTVLMPRPCLPLAAPSHHGEGTKAGSLREMQETSKDRFVSRTPHRLESFLKLHCSLRLLTQSSFVPSASTGIRPLLWANSDPCLSCPLLQEISCTSIPILASAPWQTQTSVRSISLPNPLSVVTAPKTKQILHRDWLS